MNEHRLRVAMLSEHASPLALAGGVDAGGQNVYVDSIARAMGERGHEVDVLTRRDDPRQPDVVALSSGVRVLHVDAGPPQHVPKEKLLGWMPAFAREAQRRLQAEPPYDVIHANFFMSGWVGLTLRPVLQAPLVTTFHALGLVRREHQGKADTFPAARIAIERSLVRQSDRLIAECPQDRSDLIRLYGAVPQRIDMVPCGVDTALFHPGSRAEARLRLGLSQNEFIVLQLGRIVPRKGIDNVIRAMAELPAPMHARLVVVGGDARSPDPHATPEIGRLMCLAASCGAQRRVTFVGRRDRHELRDWYVAADVFVTTPWYEPFGITPLESMACGTPVIGSSVGGIRYTVQEGITGYLVPPKDPAALSERLAALHDRPLLKQALGAAGVARVQQRFTWGQVADDLASVFDDVSHGAVAARRGMPPRSAAPLFQPGVQ